MNNKKLLEGRCPRCGERLDKSPNGDRACFEGNCTFFMTKTQFDLAVGRIKK
jgi:hypothetical protein